MKYECNSSRVPSVRVFKTLKPCQYLVALYREEVIRKYGNRETNTLSYTRCFGGEVNVEVSVMKNDSVYNTVKEKNFIITLSR